MAVIDDDIGRRRFLSQAVMGFGVLFGVGSLAFRFLQFLVPMATSKRLETVLVANADTIAAGEAAFVDVGRHRLALVDTADGPVAFSRRCTDLGCLVSWSKPRGQFVCPCHQGVFDRNGVNIAGPPPRPLDRYDVVKRGGQLYVKIDV
jgi:cytochrome b6-f complex iron-sulfur subunit